MLKIRILIYFHYSSIIPTEFYFQHKFSIIYFPCSKSHINVKFFSIGMHAPIMELLKPAQIHYFQFIPSDITPMRVTSEKVLLMKFKILMAFTPRPTLRMEINIFCMWKCVSLLFRPLRRIYRGQ